MSNKRYRGRFAPSPTGPLHFGSLVSALGSWLDARAHDGEWLLRMEDLDQQRVMPGAGDDILRTLESLGLTWDGAVTYQSHRNALYSDALETLRRGQRIFACACTRREVADSALVTGHEPVYPGTCRNGLPAGRTARAWRLRVDTDVVKFEDRVQGPRQQDLPVEVGDFVVMRADGYYAYQLAVVVDDAEQGVTDIVRGADLLDSTPRQIHLQNTLRLPSPSYAHLPVAINRTGEKLSKQTRAPAIDLNQAAATLREGLAFLGQPIPSTKDCLGVEEVLAWALKHWRLASIPRQLTRLAPGISHPSFGEER